jgi:hypothetical protein
MAISPAHTFQYRFAVEAWRAGAAAGQGSGAPIWGSGDAMVGPRPRFELSSGWLTLYPTEGWTLSLPHRWFSDVERRPLTVDDVKRSGEEFRKASEEAWAMVRQSGQATSLEAHNIAMAQVQRQRGMTRDLASYSLFVGAALGEALRAGDELNFSRDGNGDFRYSLSRGSEAVFSAGSVGRTDGGGPVAVWQEYDNHPNPHADALREQFKNLPNLKIAETISTHRPCVTARVKDQSSHLSDGDELHGDGFYVFLARSNKNVPQMAFEFTPRAVHAAGRLDVATKEMIVDAARQLLIPKTRLL